MVNEATPGVLGQRYRILNLLGEGGMGSVYRAIDRLSGQVLALKRVLVPPDALDFSTRSGSGTDYRLALAQEFQLLTALRHPGVISVFDYGFDNNQLPYLTMELVENAQTIRDAALDQPWVVQIELLIQLLRALLYLHRRGVVHRDLKPSNVLVQSGQVKVLDFGISTTKDQQSDVSGTITYMAPEVLRGEPATVASDLYAVGVIAFELLAGYPLFKPKLPSVLIDEILTTPLDALLHGLDAQSVELLQKFLATDPYDRYNSAADAIAMLSEIIHQPVVVESGAYREGFLQTSKLVGRDAEIRQLSDGLMGTLAGLGGSWLVGGESGIGKTRLLDELRTLGLVNGALVLRGQATSFGSRTYELWREPLRRLCLSIDIDDVEASIFKTVVPDIANILERTIPDAPQFDSEATQARLLSTISNVFKRQNQPTVILLENLHWADPGSLSLLAWLVQLMTWLPVMIVGSYRDDEQPRLAAQFPEMQPIKLERLSSDFIADFSDSTLGEIPNRAEIVKLLQRETEGNPFFMVEVVRALAEEAGQLDQVGTMTLPDQVFTGGVRRIVERRLSRLPIENRPLLEVAAVGGNLLDVAVLRAVAPTTNVDQWLSNCADGAVLDLQDGRWHFAHDKLRQGVLSELHPDRQRTLHQQIASAIEQAHPDSPDQFANLAYHWGEAQELEKESYYSARAGEQALRSGAYQTASPYLQRALQIELQSVAAGPGQKGRALRQAHLGRQLAEAFYGTDELAKGQAEQERALKLLGKPVPKTRLQVFSQITLDRLVQIARRVIPAHPDQLSEENRATLLETMYGQQQLAQINYWKGDVSPLVAANLRVLTLADSLGLKTPAVEAQSDVTMGFAIGDLGLHRLASMFTQRARKMLPQVTDLNVAAWVLQLVGTYNMGVGRWAAAEEDLTEAVKLANDIGHKRRWQESSSLLATAIAFQGNSARTAQMRSDLSTVARRESTPAARAWVLLFEAEGALQRGLVNDALTLLDEVTGLVEDSNRLALVRVLAYHALANLLMEDYESAQRMADRAIDLIDEPVHLIYQLPAYTALAQVYLRLWEDTIERKAEQKFKLPAEAALKMMKQTMQAFPVNQANVLRIQGRIEWLTGERTRAQTTLAKSLAVAERFGMPYEQAMAHYQMVRLSEPNDPSRQAHKERAMELFKQVGAIYYLARTQML